MSDLRVGAGGVPPAATPIGNAQPANAGAGPGSPPVYDLAAVPTPKSAEGGGQPPAAGPLSGMSLDELRKLVSKLINASLLAAVLDAVASQDAVPDDPKAAIHDHHDKLSTGGAPGSITAALVAAGADPAAAQQIGSSLDQDQVVKLKEALEELMRQQPSLQNAGQPSGAGIEVPQNPLQV